MSELVNNIQYMSEIKKAFVAQDLNKIKKLFRKSDNITDRAFIFGALNCDNIEIIEYIIQQTGAEYKHPEGETTLTYLLRVPPGQYRRTHINVALKYVKNINMPGENGDTALSLTLGNIMCLNKKSGAEYWLQIMHKLLDLGATYDGFITISDFCSILRWNNYEMVEILLPFVKDINEKYEEGNALEYAKVLGVNSDIIELLEASGAVMP